MGVGELTVIDMPDASPEKLCFLELNDLGNGERLVARAGGKLVHVPDAGWHAFVGTHWSREEGEQRAHRLAHDVARGLREEAKALADMIEARALPKWLTEAVARDRLGLLFKWAGQSGMANKTSAMLAQASTLAVARREEFDGEPLALNMLNGTLRFGRGEDGAWRAKLCPHDPADRFSRVTAAAYDPAAACPEWDRHLRTVLPDAEVRQFFRALIGYSLIGLRIEQIVVILQGKGGDGKSTTMDIIRQILGGYAAAADVKTFMAGAERSGADASPDLARLAGDCRLVSTGEPKRGAALDEAKIKAITGGSPIAARELHGQLFEYVPGFLLVLECNAKPRISGDDDGIWRRIQVVMFPHQFKGQAIDKGIKDRLLGEASGIINWAIEGLLDWLTVGRLEPPQSVLDAVEDYRRAANPFGEWMAERVDISDPHAEVLSSALFADYEQFCNDNDVGDRERLTQTAFGRMLGDRQLIKKKNPAGKIVRKGARLRARDGSAPLAEAAGAPGGGFDELERP